MVEIDISKLKPVLRKPNLSLEANTVVEATVWKIYQEEKFFKGESQGDCVTFELTTSGKETYVLQSKSTSSWTMLNEWDDKKAPCHVYVWKELTGSRPIIMWCYREV